MVTSTLKHSSISFEFGALSKLKTPTFLNSDKEMPEDIGHV